MTPEEQRRGEGLERRLAREEPEPTRRDGSEPGGQLVEETDADDELVAEMETGRREEPSEERTLLDVMGSEPEGVSPEEGAVRVQDEAPGGSDAPSDGYVEDGDDGSVRK